jgi:hypothetical protein
MPTKNEAATTLYFHLGQAPPLAPLTEIGESLTKVSSDGVASIHAMTVGVSKANPNIVISLFHHGHTCLRCSLVFHMVIEPAFC